MEYLIDDFLMEMEEGEESIIVERGEAYFETGMVRNLTKLDKHTFTAKVSGSGYRPYNVEIKFNKNGEVAECSCSCPYEWGEVCKHSVAVLLAIEEEMEEDGDGVPETDYMTFLPDSAGRLEELVCQAPVQTLQKLIIERCKEDHSFRLDVLSVLDAPGSDELAAVKKMMNDSIQKNRGRSYWASMDWDAVCGDLNEALEKARSRMERGEHPQALDILQYLLIKCAELLDYAQNEYNEYYDGNYYNDDGDASEPVSDTAEIILDLIEECSEALSKNADGEKRERQLDGLLTAAGSPSLDGWHKYCYGLLYSARLLADQQSVNKLYALMDKWEQASDAKFSLKLDRQTRYAVILNVNGPAAARAYLDKNLEIDELLLTAIQQDMEEGNFANAEQLCLKKAEQLDQRRAYDRRWNHLLYEIYEKWGGREKQAAQARTLVLLGDWEYYKNWKELLLADSRWDQEYPKLRDEVRAVRPYPEYMRLLADEQETGLLMEQVRLHRETVFQYGEILAPVYSGEIYQICAELIQESAEPVSGRKEYQRLCGQIKLMDKFGGRQEALHLIDGLSQQYPRRRAMLEELQKTREQMT